MNLPPRRPTADPAWKDMPALAVWPSDEDDPMWQFRRTPDGAVEVCGRDGTNWISMSGDDWDDLVATLDVMPVSHVWEEKRL